MGLHPLGQVGQGVIGELDIGIQNKVAVAGQLGQHRVVSGAEAAVARPADHPDRLAVAGGQLAILDGLVKLVAGASSGLALSTR